MKQRTAEIKRHLFYLFCIEDMKVQYVPRSDYIGQACSRTALSHNGTSNHMWLFKLELIKLKIQFLILLAPFQMLNGYMELVATILLELISSISIIAEMSIGLCCSRDVFMCRVYAAFNKTHKCTTPPNLCLPEILSNHSRKTAGGLYYNLYIMRSD